MSQDEKNTEEELGESAKDEEASIYKDNECFICIQLLQICKVANLKKEREVVMHLYHRNLQNTLLKEKCISKPSDFHH
eukprot:6163564-Ditylum_brightwellii.AAC.1